MSEDGFNRIAGIAARQADRKRRRERLLQPTRFAYASLEEAAHDFEITGTNHDDLQAVHRVSHRVWQIRPIEGGFELIRAQDETIEDDTNETKDEPGSGFASSYSLKVGSRVAQAGACSCGGTCPCDCGCAESGACVCIDGCPCECGCGSAAVAQAPTTPASPPPTIPAPGPMTAGIRDIIPIGNTDRLANARRGTKVLVRIGRRQVLRGKVLLCTASHFDILLENGATSRVLPQDVAIDRQLVPKAAGQTPTRKTAVDDKAKEYWSAYWKEYGRELTKTDLPRAVTDRAQPATPAGKQKPPTKSALKQGAIVDIGSIWMADGCPLRTGTVKITAVRDAKLDVEDPFGNKASVPPAAVSGLLTAADFTSVRKHGTAANRARLLQTASAALTWRQLCTRYSSAARKIMAVRSDVAAGIRIGLAGGAVPGSGVAALGKLMAMRDGGSKLASLDVQAIDQKGKEYYKAYWGDYGSDLVKEIRRRIRADLITRAAGRAAPVIVTKPVKKQAQETCKQCGMDTPILDEKGQCEACSRYEWTGQASKRQATLRVQATKILTAHVHGIMRRNGVRGRYHVMPDSVSVSANRNGHTLTGRFVGCAENASPVNCEFKISMKNGKAASVGIRVIPA